MMQSKLGSEVEDFKITGHVFNLQAIFKFILQNCFYTNVSFTTQWAYLEIGCCHVILNTFLS